MQKMIFHTIKTCNLLDLKDVTYLISKCEELIVIYWPYIKQKLHLRQMNINKQQNEIGNTCDVFERKSKVIYDNSILGIMIGITFFHLMPLTNKQITSSLIQFKFVSNQQDFPFGNLVILATFVSVLILTNYFYNCNSSKSQVNKLHFRNRNQYEYEMLTNKKLKLKRRIGTYSILTQLLTSLPSILSTSSLTVSNKFQSAFLCFMLVAFQKYLHCRNFGKSYIASGLQIKKAQQNILVHCGVSFIYMVLVYILCLNNSLFSGIANGITAGVFLYEVMIQKLATNFQEKKQLLQKIVFLFAGIFITCLF